MIDITITATRRPDILRQTLASFERYMFPGFQDYRLIINIDPIGPSTEKETLAALKFFDLQYLVMSLSPSSSFPQAFHRVWSAATAEWIFHLEDDWELLRPIDLADMLAIMSAESDLAILRLPVFPAGREAMKNWNLWFPWNGRYFECPADKRIATGFCGHPSLIRGEFVRRTVQLLNPDRNPEKQFHDWRGNPTLIAEVQRWRYGVWAKPSNSPAIRDLGRPWMVTNGYRKAGNKAHFTRWESDAIISPSYPSRP
ncbi:MAG: hypothetical protein AB1641_22025 [Thermodesulfobacteriota bacterium]